MPATRSREAVSPLQTLHQSRNCLPAAAIGWLAAWLLTAAAAAGEPTGTQYYHPRSHPTHGYRGLDRDSYQPPYHKDGRPTHGYHDQGHGLYQPPYYKDSHDEPYGRYGGDGYYPKHDDATQVDANCTANWWKKADAKDTCICATIEKCLPPPPPPQGAC